MYGMFTLKVKNARFIALFGAKEIHCFLNLIMIMFIKSLWAVPFCIDRTVWGSAVWR